MPRVDEHTGSPSSTRRQPDSATGRFTRHAEKHWLQQLAIYLAFVLIYLAVIAPVKYPASFYDELVYLGFARLFSGTAAMPQMWGGALGHFGYSLLIAPAFLFFTGFSTQYKVVLIINCFLLATTYLSTYRLLRSVWPHTTRWTTISASCIACLYPAFLIYPSFAGSENAFVPVFAALIVVLIEFLRKPKIGWAVLLGVAATLTFAIHNRGLSVAILVCLTILVAGLRRTVPFLPSTVAVITTALGWWAVVAFRHYLEHTTGILFPDPAGQPFTAAHVMPFLQCFGGQIFGLCIATAGLYALGFVAWYRLLRSGSSETVIYRLSCC